MTTRFGAPNESITCVEICENASLCVKVEVVASSHLVLANLGAKKLSSTIMHCERICCCLGCRRDCKMAATEVQENNYMIRPHFKNK